MFPYYILLALPAAVAVTIRTKDRERRDRIVLDVFFAVFLLLLVLRNESVGCDLGTYRHNFDLYLSYTWNHGIQLIWSGAVEAGYLLLSKLIGLFTDNFRIVIIVCAIISVIPIWKLYRIDPDYGYLAVVLFVNIAPFSMYFSGLRQAMAMAFVYPVYCFTKEKKLFRCLISIFIAFLFHKSALILLLFYPVYHLRLKSKWYLFAILPVIAFIWYFAQPIFVFLVGFVGDDYYVYSTGIRETGAFMVSLLLSLFVVYAYVIPDNRLLDEETLGMRNLLVLSAILQLFSSVHSIAMRMNYYYLLLIPILIPRVIRCSAKENRALAKLSFVIFIVFFTFYFYYKAYTGEDILEVYPYAFMWS